MNQKEYQVLELPNIQQLRQFLAQINDSNRFQQEQFFSFNTSQSDYSQQVKQVIQTYSEQINKKKSLIHNLIHFSIQLLNDVEHKTSKLQISETKYIELQQITSKLIEQKNLILTKINLMEEQAQNLKTKLEEAQTCISQTTAQKSQIQLIKFNEKDVKNFFYQSEYYSQSRSLRMMEKCQENVQNKFLALIKSKDEQIMYLEQQISKMHQQFNKLELQVQVFKNSKKNFPILQQLQLHNLKQQIDQNVQTVNFLSQQSLLDKNQAFQIGSNVIHTQNQSSHMKLSENDSQNQKIHNDSFENQSQQDRQIQISCIKSKNKFRNTLKSQIFDFCNSTFKNIEFQDEQLFCTLNISSTAVQTQNVKKASKGVQADFNSKVIRKNHINYPEFKKIQTKSESIIEEKKIKKSFLMQIFDFTMQKVVSQRIKRKKNTKK